MEKPTEVNIKFTDKLFTDKYERPKNMTLRGLLELLYRQQGTEQRFQAALDMPLNVGVSDGHLNFDDSRIFCDYPHFRESIPAVDGVHNGSPGFVRIDCSLTRKRMVEAKK